MDVEKHLYTLVVVTHKLRSYFHAHTITIITNEQLKHFLQNPDLSGRLVKWAIELREFRIQFAPKKAIKWQVLADFKVDNMGNGLANMT